MGYERLAVLALMLMMCGVRTAEAQCAGGMCPPQSAGGLGTYGGGGLIHGVGRALFGPNMAACAQASTYGYPAVQSVAYSAPIAALPVQTVAYDYTPVQTAAWVDYRPVQTVARSPFVLDTPVIAARSPGRRVLVAQAVAPTPVPTLDSTAPSARPPAPPDIPPTARTVPLWMIDGPEPAVVLHPPGVLGSSSGLDPLRGLR